MGSNFFTLIKYKPLMYCTAFVIICYLLVSSSSASLTINNSSDILSLNETNSGTENITIVNVSGATNYTSNVTFYSDGFNYKTNILYQSLKYSIQNNNDRTPASNVNLNNSDIVNYTINVTFYFGVFDYNKNILYQTLQHIIQNNSDVTNDNTNITLSSDELNYKTNILYQILQFITFAITIIIVISIALYQLFEPKFHPLLKTLVFRKKNILGLLIIFMIFFGTLIYNFFNMATNFALNIELVILILSSIFLFYFFYKLIYYSNKSDLIIDYLNSLTEDEIMKEVCIKFEYPDEIEISQGMLMLESITDSSHEISEKKKKRESDIESIFDILSSMIEKSEYKFFCKHLDEVNKIVFPVLKNDKINQVIKKKVASFLIENHDKLINTSINENKYIYYIFLIESYENLGKWLIDVEDLETLKILVDQIGQHSFDINKRIFHQDYSYRASDLILSLINYYIDKDTYDDYTVQTWLEIVGAIAEDIAGVDYKVKYRSIRVDYTRKTISEENPVYPIINKLKLLNKRIILEISNTDDDYKNGERIIETISVILKNILLKIIEKNDSSIVYDISSAYQQIATVSIDKELHYALPFIMRDLDKCANETILNEWKNEANTLIFTIGRLGFIASKKDFKTQIDSKNYYEIFADSLKKLFQNYYLKFDEEPYSRRTGDFFTELGKHTESKKFEEYYNTLMIKI